MSAFNFRKNSDFDTRLSDDNSDTVDKAPKSSHAPLFSFVSSIFSIILHFIDLGFDLYLAHSYATTGKYASFIWTVAFILVSSVIINLLSVTMYLEDRKKDGNTGRAVIRISLCILGIPVQSALLIRYFDSLRHCVKSLRAESQSNIKQQQKYFNKMLNENSDAALLRIFECYLESAPQLILQSTLFVKDYSQGFVENQTLQVIAIILGFVAMGVSMANYQRCIRFDQEDKENISILASRILTIVAMAILYSFWTCVAVVVHWCAMSVWVALSSKSKFCGKNKILEVIFYGIVGLVYIFNFLNLNEGPTRQSYVIFYLLCLAENVIATIIWGVNSVSVIKNWVYFIFLIFPIFCILLSALFLIVYYKFVHPNIGKGCRRDETG